MCRLVQRLVLRAFDELLQRAGGLLYDSVGDTSFWTVCSTGQFAFPLVSDFFVSYTIDVCGKNLPSVSNVQVFGCLTRIVISLL